MSKGWSKILIRIKIALLWLMIYMDAASISFERIKALSKLEPT